ncbi:MAG: hypothetical protein L7U72_06860 [Rubripirellula sp.]|nr:hypothetical protein [Rubripirellula sp.]
MSPDGHRTRQFNSGITSLGQTPPPSNCKQNSVYRNSNRQLCLYVICTSLATLFAPAITMADNFRVTTKVYSGKNVDESSKHLILFQEGVIYDFPQIDTRFVTIFDSGKKLVTIMDRETQVQASVTEDDLIKVTAQARAAATTEDQKKQLGINAIVEPSKLVQGYRIAFGGLEYHMTGQKASSPEVAREFAKFVDLAARLNLVRRLGPPPFGRMTLNQHLADRGEIPLETTLLLKRDSGTQEYRSTLAIEPFNNLNETDQKKIQEAAGMRAIYKQVDLKSFPTP